MISSILIFSILMFLFNPHIVLNNDRGQQQMYGHMMPILLSIGKIIYYLVYITFVFFFIYFLF